MPKKGKGIRSRYDHKKLELAVAAVQAKRLSIREALKEYEVPKSTIGDRITGKVQPGASPGKKPVFPIELENDLATKIKEAAAMGFGITRAQLCMKVARLATVLHLKTPFRNGIPGKDWVDGFKRRHQELSLRSPTPLNSVRARMLNPEVTRKYFADLHKTLDELSLTKSPEKIWNIDETNVSLTHKPSKVLAECGQRNVPGRVGNCRDGVTVLACINAAGSDVPPLVIVKGLTEKSLRSYNTTAGPSGAKYTFQKKAWMEDILGVTWFTDHFLKHCGPERPQLILLDSHSSHETLGLIELARENNIHLFALPPHTAQYLNPLDKTVFGPFQREYDRQCTDFMSTSPSNLVTKWEWPRLFNLAYIKTVNRENIVKGFEVCGIHPFNPSRIAPSAFAPSKPFDCAFENNDTPTSVSSALSDHDSSTAADTDLAATDSSTAVEDLPTLIPAVPTPATVTTPEPLPGTSIMTLPALPTAESLDIGPVTVIATAENPTVDDSEMLLNLITSGQLEIVSKVDNSDLFSNASSPSNANCDTISWKSQVNSIFSVPSTEETQKKPNNRKKITCHRLLTSDDIYMQKKKEEEEKERKEKEKEERKLTRKIKAEEKKKETEKKKNKKMRVN